MLLHCQKIKIYLTYYIHRREQRENYTLFVAVRRMHSSLCNLPVRRNHIAAIDKDNWRHLQQQSEGQQYVSGMFV